MENAADQELVKEEKLKKNDREKFSMPCHVPEAVRSDRIQSKSRWASKNVFTHEKTV